jgi:hypothetical protein
MIVVVVMHPDPALQADDAIRIAVVGQRGIGRNTSSFKIDEVADAGIATRKRAQATSFGFRDFREWFRDLVPCFGPRGSEIARLPALQMLADAFGVRAVFGFEDGTAEQPERELVTL